MATAHQEVKKMVIDIMASADKASNVMPVAMDIETTMIAEPA